MYRSAAQLREDAIRIWHAGVAAVDPARLIRQNVEVDDGWIRIADEQYPLDTMGRLIVVGAGKAGASMVRGLESALGESVLREKRVFGCVSVPEDCIQPTQAITLVPGRPAGVNEPTDQGVQATRRMVELVEGAGPDDLVICLISGGGSALMPLPAPGISLDDKLAVTRELSAAGATIEQLNAVRKRLSGVKGGKLARRLRGGRLVSLLLSDVLGDPLDVIASGPTVPDSGATDPREVIQRFAALGIRFPPSVMQVLAMTPRDETPTSVSDPRCYRIGRTHVVNRIIGNNATAVDEAGLEAERLGYSHAMTSARQSEGEAESVGQHLAAMAVHMRSHAGPDCLISGGEPTVRLVDSEVRGRGGRNQQLVLASLRKLLAEVPDGETLAAVVLSGGTDGEDGPTDAAGAVLDPEIFERVRRDGPLPGNFLERNDAYTFWENVGGLLKTGPTGTNVCDLRVVLVARRELPQ